MKNIRKVATWLAGLSSSAGLACILGFLISENSQEDYLLGAVILTSISVSALLVSVFFLSPTSVFLSHHTQYRIVTALPKSLTHNRLTK